MLSHFDRKGPQLQGTLASVKGLTTAVLDINHLFIDSKHVYRSHVISVFNDSDDSQIDKVSQRPHAFCEITLIPIVYRCLITSLALSEFRLRGRSAAASLIRRIWKKLSLIW